MTAHNNGICDTFCVRNSLIENNYYGLLLTGASPWLEGNTIQLNSRDGIWLVTSSPEIKDNTIQNNSTSYAGIRIGNASHPSVMGNVITGQGYGLYIYPVNRSEMSTTGLEGNSEIFYFEQCHINLPLRTASTLDQGHRVNRHPSG